jgi:hypothetical protein
MFKKFRFLNVALLGLFVYDSDKYKYTYNAWGWWLETPTWFSLGAAVGIVPYCPQVSSSHKQAKYFYPTFDTGLRMWKVLLHFIEYRSK